MVVISGFVEIQLAIQLFHPSMPVSGLRFENHSLGKGVQLTHLASRQAADVRGLRLDKRYKDLPLDIFESRRKRNKSSGSLNPGTAKKTIGMF